MKAAATTLFPFVPSGPDFARALEFFAALGFETKWREGGLAGLRFGGAYFLLQDIDAPEWQKNQQLTFVVNDLEAYWTELVGKDLGASFAGVKFRPPTDFPWGREIHFIDPGGVCWHVRQTAAPPVVEIAQLKARPGEADALRDGLAAARAVIARAPGYIGSVFYQGVEDPESFVLRVEWTSLEAHMDGFRGSPLLAEWRSHFYHRLAEPPSVTHHVAFAGP